MAVLSRGYKRKTKGYRLATALSTASEVGDEPFQMSHKFPTVYVAVDADRPDGVRHLISDTPTADVGAIILDDAYQHRYIKPGLNILLTDFNRLFIYDSLLPAGRLRESAKGKDRADIVIVTKCPSDIDASTISLTAKALRLQPVSHSTSRRCATVSRTGSFKTMVNPSHCLHSMHRPNRQRCSPTGTYCLSQVSPHPR